MNAGERKEKNFRELYAMQHGEKEEEWHLLEMLFMESDEILDGFQWPLGNDLMKIGRQLPRLHCRGNMGHFERGLSLEEGKKEREGKDAARGQCRCASG